MDSGDALWQQYLTQLWGNETPEGRDRLTVAVMNHFIKNHPKRKFLEGTTHTHARSVPQVLLHTLAKLEHPPYFPVEFLELVGAEYVHV